MCSLPFYDGMRFYYMYKRRPRQNALVVALSFSQIAPDKWYTCLLMLISDRIETPLRHDAMCNTRPCRISGFTRIAPLGWGRPLRTHAYVLEPIWSTVLSVEPGISIGEAARDTALALGRIWAVEKGNVLIPDILEPDEEKKKSVC